RISRAALLVKVTATIFHGGIWRRAISHATRCVSTRVLPEPGPARTKIGPSPAETASCCLGLSESSNGSVIQSTPASAAAILPAHSRAAVRPPASLLLYLPSRAARAGGARAARHSAPLACGPVVP